MVVAHECRDGHRLRVVQRGPELGDEGIGQVLPLTRVARQLVQELDEPLKQHVVVIVAASLFGGVEETDGAHVVESEGLDVLQKAGLRDADAARLLPTAVFEEGRGLRPCPRVRRMAGRLRCRHHRNRRAIF